MELKKLIKKTLINTCVIFTILTILYSLLVVLVNSDAKEILLEATRIVLFFIFSFMVALANSILSVKFIHPAVRYILHYILCAVAFYLCVLFPVVNSSTRGSFVVVGLSAFTVLYVAIAIVIMVARTKIKHTNEKKEAYTNRFSK